MSNSRRDFIILQKIIKYCDEISETIVRFGNSYEIFQKDKIYQNAASMCILQIGELAGHLSEYFKSTHLEIPWQDIKGMRNLAAHEYEKIRSDFLWDTMVNDIPELRGYCTGVLGD